MGAPDQGQGSPTLNPPVSERLVMPAEFGRRFIIFADAEEDFDWSKPLARENTSTTSAAHLLDATHRFNALGAKPTYMVDFPIVNNAQSAEIIQKLHANDMCDVGTQLHPWVNPPFDEDVCNRNSFTGNLPLELQRAKLISLTDKITSVIGTPPIVYRAGRYGLGSQTMDLLTDAGYRMDVSVRSRFDYSTNDGVDYSRHPIWPWRINQQMIEVPLSTAWTGSLRRHPQLFKSERWRGTLARTGLLARIPLTPEGVPLNDALEAIAILDDDGLEIFSLSFHTPSVAIGNTPYVRDARDLKLFWLWWDGVLNGLAKRGIVGTRPDEIIAAADHTSGRV